MDVYSFSYYSCILAEVGRSEPPAGAYNYSLKEQVYVDLEISGWLLSPSDYIVWHLFALKRVMFFQRECIVKSAAPSKVTLRTKAMSISS